MKFPDRIVAIGGAGKAITMELLESEWVIRGILQPRPSPPSLQVTILDTAEGEENNDRERIRSIRERIAELEEAMRDPDKGRLGSIDIDYKLITDDIRLDGSIDLLGEEAVPRITAGNGMDEDNWWLREQHINENLDFAKGVVRKRGLGKAIYYKAYAEDDQISKYIDLPEKGKVAILAGLGGGTGSGILIDLARHLKERQRTAEITLFGVLPNHTEGRKENTNAYAALSELEYLSLQDEQLFKDRILMPIDPTEFDGKTGNRIQTEELLKEFDQAVIYLIAAYYNTEGLEDPFSDSPTYAPFTIGIPQILRYNVEAINDARDAFRDILEEKEEALQTEAEIYEEVNRFLTKHFDGLDAEAGLRDLDRTDLNERLSRVESLLEFDLFNELEYESVEIFEDIVEDAKTESGDIEDQVDTISASIRAVDATGRDTGQYVDNIDEHLAEILEKDLSLIAQRKEILEQIKVIDDKRIRDAIEFLIGSSDSGANPGVKLQRLEAKMDDLDEKRDQLQDEFEQAQQDLEDARDEMSEEITRRTNNWEREVEDDISQLQTLQNQDVEQDLRNLRSRLDQFLANVVNAESEDEIENITEGDVRNVLDAIENKLSDVGVSFQEQRRDIQGSLSKLKQAREAFIRMNKEEGTFESLTPWESSTEEEKKEAHKDFRMQKNRIDDMGMFSVGPPGANFTAEIQFDEQTILNELDQRKRELRNRIVNEIRSRVDQPREDLIRDIEQQLTDDVDRGQLEDTVRQLIRVDVGETDSIEQRIEEIESDLEAVTTDIEVYQPSIDLFQRLNNKRETYLEKTESFRKRQDNYTDQSSQNVATRREEHAYVKNLQPEDIFRATGQDDLATSDILNSREESQRVRSTLERLAKNARNEEYTALRRRKLSKGRTRYNEQKVRVSVLSPAVNQLDNEVIDFEDIFAGAFDIGGSAKRAESPYTSWATDVGGPWDIGLCAFITGVFLDNIRKVVQADGYHSGYSERRDEIGDDIIVHHSNGLSEGHYIRRDEIMNMEDESDVEFYLRDEPDIVEDLLDEYVTVVETN